MSNWNFTQAKFGGVVFAVLPTGGIVVRPGTGVKPGRDIAAGVDGFVPSDEPAGERTAWTFNGKPYTSGFSVKIGDQRYNLGVPVVEFNYFDNWTDSARRQLQTWVEANYASMATPVRIAEARLLSALGSAYYATEKAEAAEKVARLARDEVAAARANLAAFGE